MTSLKKLTRSQIIKIKENSQKLITILLLAVKFISITLFQSLKNAMKENSVIGNPKYRDFHKTWRHVNLRALLLRVYMKRE